MPDDDQPDTEPDTDSSTDLERPKSKILAQLQAESLPAARLSAAAPSKPAQTLAFAAIVVAGVCGALIGYAFTDLQCNDGCAGWAGLGAIVGAVVGAVGVAIVAVLVLRAMDEWETVQNREAKEHPARSRPIPPTK